MDLTLEVPVLDRDFHESTGSLRVAWAGIYPALARGGALTVGSLVAGGLGASDHGSLALFSGGIDSIATALMHRDEDLTFCTFWGLDVPTANERAWRVTREQVLRLSARLGATATFVKTNARSLLDESMLTSRLGIEEGKWWMTHHGIAVLGMAAPVAVFSRVSRVYIAAGYTSAFDGPRGSIPVVDEAVRFAGIRCIHDGSDKDRVDKARLIHEHLPDVKVAVCFSGSSRAGVNCGRCEKCMRSAASFRVLGVDPAAHGIKVREAAFQSFRRRLQRGRYPFSIHNAHHWQAIQNHALERTAEMSPGLRGFFRWLATQDLVKLAHESHQPWWRRARRLVGLGIPHRLRPVARRAYLRLFRRW
jgi:7-cyano-7-deazaguanine synthase in queuosine biosynthesis